MNLIGLRITISGHVYESYIGRHMLMVDHTIPWAGVNWTMRKGDEYKCIQYSDWLLSDHTGMWLAAFFSCCHTFPLMVDCFSWDRKLKQILPSWRCFSHGFYEGNKKSKGCTMQPAEDAKRPGSVPLPLFQLWLQKRTRGVGDVELMVLGIIR